MSNHDDYAGREKSGKEAEAFFERVVREHGQPGYVDGEREDSADAKPIALNSVPLRIGSNLEALGRGFSGWIAEVRLYGYGLSQAEVKALYQGAGAREK